MLISARSAEGAGVTLITALLFLAAAQAAITRDPSPAGGRGTHASSVAEYVEQSGANSAQEQEAPSPEGRNASAGLIINAVFDSSITNDPNAAEIEAAINNAIGVYESLFADQISVTILFRYSTTIADGSAMPANTVSYSEWPYYNIAWNDYIDALKADATTANDNAGNATLPGSAMTTYMRPTSANGRAVGLQTAPALTATGAFMVGAPYDGIITVNSAYRIQFTRPAVSGQYDALRFIEHEIDEVLGFGSAVRSGNANWRPQDLFSWSSPGVRNTTVSGTRYFSIDGGNSDIVDFNQVGAYDTGDWFSEACPQTQNYVQNAFACPGQAADVTASSPEAINLDVIGYDLVTGGPAAQLLNISTRMEVLTGSNVLIGGFIVSGSEQKKVLIRGLGPSLPVTGALSDPTLELHDSSTTLQTNDNWKDTQRTEIEATTIPPSNDLESALVATLAANNSAYTAILAGNSGGTGVGLVEVYDLGQRANSNLANISTRGFVDTGDNVMIGGLILGPNGSGPARVLVRAIGPSLAGQGVSGALQDPTLELRDVNGQLVAQNDDWKVSDNGGSQEAAIEATTIPPSDDRESALVTILNPGNYTAVVRGKGDTTGVGLVELYNLQ